MIIESIIGGMLIMTPIEMGDDYNEHLQDVVKQNVLQIICILKQEIKGQLVSLQYQM